MVVCYLGIGSNLGNRRKNIKQALHHLDRAKGIKIEKSSRIYETEPVGGPPQGRFLNAAIKIKTSLTPGFLLRTLKKIEKALGRKKAVRFGPREIDLDILFYADKIINRKNLQVPHPKIFEREFVVRPLLEII
ncbi:MAG: 2-amino-4-hydroxy-6-hydroxymethyldihydropteridine diphosphokinase [Candidatus Omnitrophica bacterium]|nr:2-amino-4-hydroxy-6-hydroxymethyldihydropteridine diphosphokinase [Candidatus Omnitrophota bacterium]MBU4346485.1 2-amino-4-hydroxy-6-hydroxymethyldihydropteridine diphosphokinase [Candidatus Omnitrophota bacterium]MBU4472622.1 2-amino-4-hydroxy-6-hydroxymethyldihydropteridine diphosphokinase [Candidatus Omnitrophota bacterium]MCG2706754.1 2-amino-4-hydroxy-6-hydroxymethyldihydropteridine diphosphokinase [Candidatus Omnitrophota bacterium]